MKTLLKPTDKEIFFQYLYKYYKYISPDYNLTPYSFDNEDTRDGSLQIGIPMYQTE